MTSVFHRMSNARNSEATVVDSAARNLVAKMPDNYAAVSQYEFSLKCKALHYDYDDPKRKVSPP